MTEIEKREQEEADAMYESYFPELSQEEQQELLEIDRKATEFIMQNDIKPNCDIPNCND